MEKEIDLIIEKMEKKSRMKKLLVRYVVIAAFVFFVFSVVKDLITSGIIYVQWYEDYRDKKIEGRRASICEANDIYDLLPYMDKREGMSEADLKEFADNYIEIDGKVGYLDENLNVKIPVMYDDIELAKSYYYAGSDSNKCYYKIKENDCVGLIGPDMDIIFEPSYIEIDVLGDNGFILVEEDKETGFTFLKTVDSNGNILNEYNLEYGYYEGCYYINDRYSFKIKCEDKEHNSYYEGVLDENLKVIVPTEYYDVVVCCERQSEYITIWYYLGVKDTKKKFYD